MIEKVIDKLEQKRLSLAKKIDFLEELAGQGEYLGELNEKALGHNRTYHYYYLPKKQCGIVLSEENSDVVVTSYGNIDKKKFIGYYKTQKSEEKILKRPGLLFFLSYPKLKYLFSKERWFDKKHEKEKMRWE
ncbi:MAG TPA: hypothetical protein VJ461_01605 [Candidatus Nanoarchaeia archaeon]|nr:hypothetical protein [Candidatus Nanoarchaeia archaeon]